MEGIHVFGGGTIPVKDSSKGRVVFSVSGGWGDSIQIQEWPKKSNANLASVVGWKNPKPKNGDVLRVPCQSGKTAICKFVGGEKLWEPDGYVFC